MEFHSEAHKAIYEKVGLSMKELFGEFARPREDRPSFAVLIGSALAHVAVYPWGDDDATICTRSYVVTKVEVTPELMHFLLRKNDDMRFGAFGLDRDNDVFFEHTIVGSTADKEELRSSVMAVLNTADKYDDEIVAKWGGERAVD